MPYLSVFNQKEEKESPRRKKEIKCFIVSGWNAVEFCYKMSRIMTVSFGLKIEIDNRLPHKFSLIQNQKIFYYYFGYYQRGQLYMYILFIYIYICISPHTHTHTHTHTDSICHYDKLWVSEIRKHIFKDFFPWICMELVYCKNSFNPAKLYLWKFKIVKNKIHCSRLEQSPVINSFLVWNLEIL